MKKRIISLICACVVLISLCGCDNIVLQPTFDMDVYPERPNGKIVAENSNFTLEWNSSMGVVLTSKSTGETWGTTPVDEGGEQVDELGMPIKKHPQVESVLLVDYIDKETNTEKTLVSYTGSVRDGRVNCKKIEKGLEVEFYFDSAEFMIPVTYTLNDDSVSISIDPKKIQENKNRIVQISLAPYWCSAENDSNDSYLFIPDGSGALVDVRSRSNQGYTYAKQVYGTDLSIKEVVSSSQEYDIRMPVFGSKSGNKASFAIVEEGAETAWIKAKVGSTATKYSAVYVSFQLRGYTNHTAELFSSTKVDRTVYYDNMNTDPIKVTYYPLSGDKANYVGMANIYRDYLCESNGLSKNENDIAFNVDILGGTMVTESFLGVPYETLYAATNLKEAEVIVKELANITDKTFAVSLKGFGSTGLDIGEIGGGYAINKNLGTKKDLNSLMNICKDSSAELYMDFDITRYSKSTNGFSTFSDAVSDAAIKRATRYLYDMAVRGEIEKSLYYLLSPARFVDATKRLVNKTKDFNITGISLATLTNSSYSDYAEKNEKIFASKSGFVHETVSSINVVKSSDKKVVSSDANIFAAVLSDAVLNVSVAASKNYIFENEVPFYQIVLKGYVPMTTSSLNLSSDWNRVFLSAVESGIGLNYTVMNNWDNVLINAQHTDMYNSKYADIKDRIFLEIQELSDYYDSTKGASIISHEILENGVRKTVFSNSVIAYVNYSASAVDSPAGEIAACDYIVVGYK